MGRNTSAVAKIRCFDERINLRTHAFMIKQNHHLLTRRKTVLKQISERQFLLNCLFIVLLFASYPSFSQNPSNIDSSKIKKQSTSSSDSTVKYGYAKITLLGHTRIVKLPALQDSDGDGIPDQLDLEPNTPQGAEVDSHGRAIDTDGDGVPDYRDKEKLTPQSCFPVDSNGVGACPEESFKVKSADSDERMYVDYRLCSISQLPSISFKTGSSFLSKKAIDTLRDVSKQLIRNPRCNLIVAGFNNIANSLKKRQIGWNRVHTVIKYLIEKEGISENRILFVDRQQEYNNSVDLYPTLDTGTSTQPFPN